MNKVVREHYPVANLPEDLQRGFLQDATVTIMITGEPASGDSPSSVPLPPMTREEFLEQLRAIRSSDIPSVTPEEAVRQIRELRDEWDNE